MRCRSWLGLGLAAALVAPAPAALAQAPRQPNPALREPCRRLVTVQAGGGDLSTAVLQMSQRFLPALPADRRAAIQAAFGHHAGELLDAAAGVCVATLTADDVAALTTFYASPEGQSIARKALSGAPLTEGERAARSRFHASPAGASVKAKEATVLMQTVLAEQPIYRKAMAELCAAPGQCPAAEPPPSPGPAPASAR
jgi:hypothetical protein